MDDLTNNEEPDKTVEPVAFVNLAEQINPKELNGDLKEMYSMVNEGKKVSIWTAIIFTIMVALVVFFATKNYRNEELISQAKALADQQTVIQRTANVIGKATWPVSLAKELETIGYRNLTVQQTQTPVPPVVPNK